MDFLSLVENFVIHTLLMVGQYGLLQMLFGSNYMVEMVSYLNPIHLITRARSFNSFTSRIVSFL